MSTVEVSATLRIAAEGGDLSDFISDHRDQLTRAIGPPSSRAGSSVWTIDLTAGEVNEIEPVLDRCVELATALRAMPGLPPATEITIWMVLWSSKEFVGLALSDDLIHRASRSRVSFVFSVYNGREDDATLHA